MGVPSQLCAVGVCVNAGSNVHDLVWLWQGFRDLLVGHTDICMEVGVPTANGDL